MNKIFPTVAIVAIAVAIGCLERPYTAAGSCDATVSCPSGAVCYHGQCQWMDAFVPNDLVSLPDGFTPHDLDQPDLETGIPCSKSATCQADKPICAANSCQACVAPTDDSACATRNPATPRCASNGECVQCLGSTDCSNPTPVCDTSTNTCRDCKANAECTSGICIFDGANIGSCAAQSAVVYVDNKGSVAACNANGMPHDGAAPATAFCDIIDGVASGKSFVLVAGQTPTANSGYSRIAISISKTITIVGPGQGVSQPATIYDTANNDQLGVTAGSGVQIEAVVDGLEIGPRSGTTLKNGVLCSATAGGTVKLTLRRSAVLHAGSSGVWATGCDVRIDGGMIQANTGGGVLFQGTDYTVENTVVANNGSTTSAYGGVQITSAGALGRAQLINITDVDNTAASGGYSGLDCFAGSSIVIFNSVVEGNLHTTEIRPTCMLAYSSFVGGVGTNTDLTNCNDAAIFENTGANPYAPKSSTSPPCMVTLLGKGLSSYLGVAAPDHDVLFSPRPQPAGSSPDDGAYEAR